MRGISRGPLLIYFVGYVSFDRAMVHVSCMFYGSEFYMSLFM